MPLLDDELRSRLPPINSQEAEDDPIVYAKFFLPETCFTWYVTEGSPIEDDYRFFGLVIGSDWGFEPFLLSDLEAIRNTSGPDVERDMAFVEGRLNDVVPPPDL